jgi:hypothetical protein
MQSGLREKKNATQNAAAATSLLSLKQVRRIE